MPTFVTKLIHDTSPDFGDNPQTITESGKPESIEMQNLIPNTYHFVKGEIYQDGVLNDTTSVETFSTLPAGSLSLTYYSTTRSGYLYDYTWNYTSTYAPSSVICTVNNSTFNGYFDYNQHTLNFNITGLSPSTTYPTVVTLTDIYGETVTVNGSITTTYVNNIYIMDTDAEENFVDVGLSYVVDGGFFSGWVDVWYDYQDPSTDLSLQHYSFSEGDTVIHCDGLADNTGYLFRASITLDDRTTVINSNIVDVDTLEATYLSFTDISGTNNTLKLIKTDNSGNTPTVSLEYSTDKSTWTTWTETNNERSVVIPANGTVYLRGNNANGFAYDNDNCHYFRSTGNVNAGGDLMRILNKDRGGATAIPENGFRKLFNGMSTLKKAPAINATTYGSRCCWIMFQGTQDIDTSNIKIVNPIFPSGSVGQFTGMFMGCRFTRVAEIFNGGEITPNDSAYAQMFAFNTNLTTAPEFTINSSSDNCYGSMFQNCSALNDISKIHFNAQSIASRAMNSMFINCTSLTSGLDLRSATSIDSNAISNMYSGCTSLNIAYAPTVTWNTAKSNNWLNNVAGSGTLYADKSIINSIPTSNASGCPTGWNMYENEYIDKYFTIKNEYDGQNVITMTSSNNSYNTTVYVSNDNGNTWTAMNTSNAGVTLARLSTGQKILLKHTGSLGHIDVYSQNSDVDAYHTISGSKNYSVSGNIASLTRGDNFLNNYTTYKAAFSFLFYNQQNLVYAENLKFDSFLYQGVLGERSCSNMFEGCTSLTTAPALIATTLKKYCCASMFEGCTSLTTAPALQATTIDNYCCERMFYGCTSLTTTPELPATTAKPYCYVSMFSGCTSLTTAPELPATVIGLRCYASMFYGCTSLTTAPTTLPATALYSNCYNSMFSGCTSLTTAPTINATYLNNTEYCCRAMFKGCTSLTTAPTTLPATTLANYCYYEMFYDCSSLVSAPALPATTLANSCYGYMFYGCTSLTTASELPATTPVGGCYVYMFNGCSKLNSITVGATSWDTNALYWVSGVAAKGTFTKPRDTYIQYGTNGIPSGWTVVNV